MPIEILLRIVNVRGVPKSSGLDPATHSTVRIEGKQRLEGEVHRYEARAAELLQELLKSFGTELAKANLGGHLVEHDGPGRISTEGNEGNEG